MSPMTTGVPDITALLTDALDPVFQAVYMASDPAPLDGKPADWAEADLQVQQPETPVTRYARLALTGHSDREDGTEDMTRLARLMRLAERAVLDLPRESLDVVTADVQSGPITLLDGGRRCMQLEFLLTLPSNLTI